MNLFKTSKPKESREEPEVLPRPAAPDMRASDAMPNGNRVATPPQAPPVAPQPAPAGIPQGTVPPMGAAPAPSATTTPAPEARPTPPPPPAPRSVPDTDALRAIVEQAVRDSEGATLEAVRLGGGTSAPALMLGGSLNFPALYQKVGVPEPSFSAEQMLTMLEKLPGGMPLEMKRETVTVTLEMLGKQIQTTEASIVGDTTRKMTTLAALTQEYERKTKERVAQGEAEIADLLALVEAKRQAVAAATRRLGTVHGICVGETERLNEVMEFFKASPPALVGQVFGKDKGAKGGNEARKPVPVESKPAPVESKPAPAPDPVLAALLASPAPASLNGDEDAGTPTVFPVSAPLGDGKPTATSVPVTAKP